MKKWIIATPPALLICLHTVALVANKIDVDNNPRNKDFAPYCFFSLFDFPAAWIMDKVGWADEFTGYLVLGGLQWLLIGGAMSLILYDLDDYLRNGGRR